MKRFAFLPLLAVAGLMLVPLSANGASRYTPPIQVSLQYGPKTVVPGQPLSKVLVVKSNINFPFTNGKVIIGPNRNLLGASPVCKRVNYAGTGGDCIWSFKRLNPGKTIGFGLKLVFTQQDVADPNSGDEAGKVRLRVIVSNKLNRYSGFLYLPARSVKPAAPKSSGETLLLLPVYNRLLIMLTYDGETPVGG